MTLNLPRFYLLLYFNIYIILAKEIEYIGWRLPLHHLAARIGTIRFGLTIITGPTRGVGRGRGGGSADLPFWEEILCISYIHC